MKKKKKEYIDKLLDSYSKSLGIFNKELKREAKLSKMKLRKEREMTNELGEEGKKKYEEEKERFKEKIMEKNSSIPELEADKIAHYKALYKVKEEKKKK